MPGLIEKVRTAVTDGTAFIPGGTWPQPITFVTGRLVKFSAEITF